MPSKNAGPALPRQNVLSGARLNRRQLLRAGGLGFLGLNLAHLFEAEALAATTAADRRRR